MKNINKILLYKNGNYKNIENRVDIILTPDFYWIKKVDIPITKERKIKTLAPSIFEDSLPSDNFSYKVLKQNGIFFVIAYNMEDIEKEIEKNNLLVRNIYFLQKEFENIDGCINIDEFFSLAKIDDIWVKIPKICSDNQKDIDEILDNLTLSNFKISYTKSGFDFDIDEKVLQNISILILILLIAQSITYFGYKKEIANIQNEKNQILSRYSLPKTSIQLKSIERRLDRIKKDIESKKSVLEYVANIPIKDISLKYISLKDKKAEIEIETKKERNFDKVINYFKRRYKNIKFEVKNSILKLWWSYE